MNKPNECTLCGRTEDETDFSDIGAICDECADEVETDQSWGAHEDY